MKRDNYECINYMDSRRSMQIFIDVYTYAAASTLSLIVIADAAPRLVTMAIKTHRQTFDIQTHT
jgi:hypothetical protein